MRRIPPGHFPRPAQGKEQYKDFDATELYCPKCSRSMPVRKRLLIVLPEGDKYEYTCAACGTSVGEKIEKNGPDQVRIII